MTTRALWTLLFSASVHAASVPAIAGSHFEVISVSPTTDAGSTVRVDVVDAESDRPLPFRAVITSSDGRHLDGSGRGVYDDGRFFADGSFTVESPPGETNLEISRGPHYVPLTFTLDVKAGESLRVKVKLHRWFAPQQRGWYSGDNHVHAQHDDTAAIRTDLGYAALQGRAGGLSFVTEAGSNVSYADIDKLDTPDFLLRHAGEIRPGPYVGHLNTPGIRSSIPDDVHQRSRRRPLPAQAVFEAVRQRGGVTAYTHPMTPRHQLHWMGATEAYSDAVLGSCADLFDVDANHTQRLWFALLNLGNQVAVSSSTDSALGRANTLSPGDRRVYCRAARFDYPSLVDAMRHGRTMATNGGPVFVFLSVADGQPGDTMTVADNTGQAHLEVRSLNALRSVELYQDGRRVAAFPVQGKQGTLEFDSDIPTPQNRRSWLVARAEDQDGKWCLTSPIYFIPKDWHQPSSAPPAWTILLAVNNATRFVKLRPNYFAHLVVTVSASERLSKIELQRNDEPVHVFRPLDGSTLHDDQMPVTGIDGEYTSGWTWYPSHESAQHFQADWPVTLSGWYSVRATTQRGQTLISDEMFFEASHPSSQSLSIAHLMGEGTQFTLWGYGEDAAIAELGSPDDQGEWWYPKNGYWHLTCRYGTEQTELGWPKEQPVQRFRQVDGRDPENGALPVPQ